MNHPITTADAYKLRSLVSLTEQLRYRAAQRSLLDYLQTVVINAQPEPKQFGQAAEWWQRELLRPKVPAFEYLAGLRERYDGPLSFWDVLARGHDKSSLEARLATWLLIASKRIIHGYIVAADREQGQLILQAMEDEHWLNPWIARFVTVQKNVVKGPAGEVTVLPADAASAFGLRGNFYICDEVTHWKNDKMWKAVLSGRQKVSPSILCVLSNAGLKGSWQHDHYKKALVKSVTSTRWSVFYRKGFLASWVDKAELADMRDMLPPAEAARLYDNEWIDPAADKDYLRREEVEQCAELGRQLQLRYKLVGDIWVDNYVAALDYGPKKDRTVLVVLHLNRDRVAVIDRMDVWEGKQEPGGRVSFEKVKETIAHVQRKFRPKLWVIDPYQMLPVIEWMRRDLGEGCTVEEWSPRAGAGNFEMAQTLRAFIAGQQVAWYPNCGRLDTPDGPETIEDELPQLVTKRMPYGYRFDHELQRHDDRAVALAMALTRAVQFPAAEPQRYSAPPPQPPADPTSFNPLLPRG